MQISGKTRATFALLTLCGAISAGFATVLMQGPQYVYKLTLNNDPSLCSHMSTVFNSRFATLWNTPMLSEGDPAFGANGPYAFPLLPGVDHGDRATFAMLADKLPSAPEFDAISWKEGRAIWGEPKESAPPQNDTLMPILVASIDFYNDGHLDTVMKTQFTRGYSYFTNTFGSGADDDVITVIRRDDLAVGPVLSLYSLRQTVPKNLTSYFAAAYQRLFRFEGRTYVARYAFDLGKHYSDMAHAPYRPHEELMSILRYYLVDDTPAQETVCQYRMIQQPEAAKQ